MRARTLALSVLLLLAPLGFAQDARTEFGVTRARLLESAVASMFNGATVEWGATLTLVNGTSRQAVAIPDLEYRHDDDGGYTAVMTVELTAGRQEIANAIAALETPAARSLAEVVAFKTNAQFAITVLRRGGLGDSSSAIEEVEDVELATMTYEQPWPDVYVTYTGTYGTPTFFGEVRWDEKLVVDPAIVANGRIPSLLARREKSGADHSDSALIEAVDENTVSFSSGTSHQLIMRCADPCLPDGRVLLALWWTTNTAAGVTP
ncbi:MAG: hypothetical protein ABI779_07315, partial [Acidobacteriota bacterium]